MGLDQAVKAFVLNENGTYDLYCFDFRKANCLQGYFEKYYTVENTVDVGFTFDKIEELYTITKYILAHKEDMKYIQKHFPPYEGFFFGSYEIDEYYFNDVEEVFAMTVQLQRCANKDSYFYYWCWY